MKYLSLSIVFLIVCNCTFAQLPSYVDTNGLLAWYPLDGNLNNVYNGPENNGIGHGTITYDTDRAGIANNCYRGNGANGIDIPTNNFPVGNAARSVSVFYKSNFPYPAVVHQLIAWGNNIALGERFGLMLSDTSVALDYRNGTVYKKIIPDNQWHNVTVTYPVGGAGSSSVKLYFDGVLSTAITQNPVSVFATDTGNIHCIGTLSYTTNQYSWLGKIDEVGVWDRELNACEVQRLFAGANAVAAIAGTLSLCKGQTATLSNAAAGGSWSSDNTAIATVGSSTGMVSGIAEGTANITYTVGVCNSSAVVTINPLPVAGLISGSSRLCANVAASLSETVTGGVWSSGNSAAATVNGATGIVTTGVGGSTVISYTVGAAGCTSTALFNITVVQPAFTISQTISELKCNGDNNGSISTSVSGGSAPFSYNWSNGAVTSAISGIGAGTYAVTVKEDSTLCSLTDSVVLINPDSLTVTIDSGIDLCRSGVGSIKALAHGGTPVYQYQWSVAATHSPFINEIDSLTSGTYSLSVTDSRGCVVQVAATVGDVCGQIEIAQGMSPNGDGINDTWGIMGLMYYPTNTVQVFDKWGNLVYEQSNYKGDWGGNSKSGGQVPDGVYYYLVKLNAPEQNGAGNVFTGALIIRR